MHLNNVSDSCTIYSRLHSDFRSDIQLTKKIFLEPPNKYTGGNYLLSKTENFLVKLKA